MPKFKITLKRTVIEYGSLIIEADDEDSAWNRADALTAETDDPPGTTWGLSYDREVDDLQAYEVEPVNV
jgi:hypothetical protein